MYVFLAQSCPTFSTPWTVSCQAPLSMNSLGKNTGVGFHFLLQGLFPTQGSNLSLLHCRQILYHLSHQGKPLVVVKIGLCHCGGKLRKSEICRGCS